MNEMHLTRNIDVDLAYNFPELRENCGPGIHVVVSKGCYPRQGFDSSHNFQLIMRGNGR